MSDPSMTGRLLVATPLLGDGVFDRTVVLLIAHGAEGALGLVLNRPSDSPVSEFVPDWGGRAAAPGVMFIGGPVAPDAVIGLGPDGTIDLHQPPGERDSPDRVRLFAGSAGWAPGQLEGEVGQQAWWVLDAEPDDAFSSDPSNLWSIVLRRQPGAVAWYAHFPPDPMVN